MKKETYIEVVAIWFTILFLYTAVSKLIEYSVFKEQISLSPLLAPIAWWISWMLPIGEIGVAVLLFMPVWRKIGMYGALGLMVGFTIYVSTLLASDADLPCSCGGVIALLSWKGHLLFNGICCLLAFSAIWINKSFKSNSTPILEG